jgi:hypothetical protein
MDQLPKGRYEIFFEPRVLPDPHVVAGTRMREGYHGRPVITPCRHDLSHRGCRCWQVIALGVLSDYQSQCDVPELVKDPLTPLPRALGTRWKVTGRTRSGETEAHRQQRDALWVVEDFRVDSHPIAQPVAAGIVEGDS